MIVLGPYSLHVYYCLCYEGALVPVGGVTQGDPTLYMCTVLPLV